MNSSEAILAILHTVRGNRPYSMESQETEQCLNITLALLVELIASNDRIDRLERQLARTSGTTLANIRTAASDPESEQARMQANETTILRALRILIDPRPTMDQRPEARMTSK